MGSLQCRYFLSLHGKLEFETLKKELPTRKSLMSKLVSREKVIIETRDKKKNPTIHVHYKGDSSSLVQYSSWSSRNRGDKQGIKEW